jgi:hypothetical protein
VTVAALLVGVIAIAALAGSPAPGDEPTPAASPGARVGAAGPTADASAAEVATPAPTTQPGQLGATPVPGPFPSEAEAALIGLLPAGLRGACSRRATVEDAVLAGFGGSIVAKQEGITVRTPITPRVRTGALCYPDNGADRLYVIEPSRTRSVQAESTADIYINFLQGRWKIPDGSCAERDRAFERWRGPRGTGVLACMNPYEGRPWIYFTFGKGRYLGFATRDDADHAALFGWWEQLTTFLP